jgi:hypothetical protein
VQYEVLRDDRVIATLWGQTFTDAGRTTQARYAVRAVDAAGNRSASTPLSTLAPPAPPPLVQPPSAPRSVTAVVSGVGLVVSWVAPASTGGSPITGYRIEVGTTTVLVGPAEHSALVDGLTTDVPHRASIVALNAVGSSAPALTDPVVIPTPVGDSDVEPLVPVRVLETRVSEGQRGYSGAKPVAGQTVELVVAGVGGVPAGARAVVLNVTGVEASGAGFVTVWPCGSARPTASNLNLDRGETAPNLVVAPVGVGGKVCVFTQSGAHLLADLSGYFT